MRLSIGVLVGALALNCSTSNASEFWNATIEAVRPDNFDVGGIFVKVAGTRTGTISCTLPDGATMNWFFISKNNPMMKDLLSAALSAKLTNANVTVIGKGTCTQGYEDVRYIQLN